MSILTRLGQVKPTTNTAFVRMLNGAWDFALYVGPMSVGFDSWNDYKRGGSFRFRNITIPQGATITNAILRFEAAYTRTTTTVKSYFTGGLIANAIDFPNLAAYQSMRGTAVDGPNNNNRTIAQVAWDNIPSHTGGVNYDSPDISSIIQEIINQPAWVSDNALMLFWDDHDARSASLPGVYRTLEWGSPGYFALIITYTTAVTVTTNAATLVASASATLNGTLDNDGGAACTCGFDYGLTVAYGTQVQAAGTYTTGQTFLKAISGLSPGTTYHFRAYADNGGEVGYGADLTFTTLGASFPAEAITRVTTIIHRYNRAKQVYSMEVGLGDVTSDFGLPEWAERPQFAMPANADKPATIGDVEKAVEDALADVNMQQFPVYKPLPISPLTSEKVTAPMQIQTMQIQPTTPPTVSEPVIVLPPIEPVPTPTKKWWEFWK